MKTFFFLAFLSSFVLQSLSWGGPRHSRPLDPEETTPLTKSSAPPLPPPPPLSASTSAPSSDDRAVGLPPSGTNTKKKHKIMSLRAAPPPSSSSPSSNGSVNPGGPSRPPSPASESDGGTEISTDGGTEISTTEARIKSKGCCSCWCSKKTGTGLVQSQKIKRSRKPLSYPLHMDDGKERRPEASFQPLPPSPIVSSHSYQTPAEAQTLSLALPQERRIDWNRWKIFFPQDQSGSYRAKLENVLYSFKDLSPPPKFDPEDELHILLQREWEDYQFLLTQPQEDESVPFPDLLEELLSIQDTSDRWEELQRRLDISGRPLRPRDPGTSGFVSRYWQTIERRFSTNLEVVRQAQIDIKQLAVDGLAAPDPSSDQVLSTSPVIQARSPGQQAYAVGEEAKEKELGLLRLTPWTYLSGLLGVYAPIPGPHATTSESLFKILLNLPIRNRLDRLKEVYKTVFPKKHEHRVARIQAARTLHPPPTPQYLLRGTTPTSTVSTSSAPNGALGVHASTIHIPSPRRRSDSASSSESDKSETSERYGGSKRGWRRVPTTSSRSNPLQDTPFDSGGSSDSSTGSPSASPRGGRRADLNFLAPLIPAMLREGVELVIAAARQRQESQSGSVSSSPRHRPDRNHSRSPSSTPPLGAQPSPRHTPSPARRGTPESPNEKQKGGEADGGFW